MESDLQKQLNLLKVNQKNEMKLPSKNADFSLLFDFRNSKKIDIDTYFELGYMGLVELSKTEDKLLGYIANIFSPLAKYYNREMKTENEIKDTDENVENLIKLINPYFENQSCHKIMEFLIKIYQVNIYNSKVLLLCFLPNHQSKVFVKMLQNINLDAIKNFSFLSASAKKGTIIIKEQIVTEVSKNYDLFRQILEFYTNNLNEGYKLSAYPSFIFDLINKVLVLKEKTNENILSLVIKFINNLFFYIQKRKAIIDNNLILIVSGVCEVLITIFTKFEISNEYYRALSNEFIIGVFPKVCRQQTLLNKFIQSLVIILAIKNETIINNEASHLLSSESFLGNLNKLSNDYDISPILLNMIYNLSCCCEKTNDYENSLQTFSSLFKNMCKFNLETEKFVIICEKTIELLKTNQTSSFKNVILDIIRFIDEIKPEQMNEAIIRLDKVRSNKEFLEKLKVNLYESLIKTKWLLVKDTEMNCLVDLLTGLTHTNNSVVINSIKQFDKILEDNNNQHEKFLSKFTFIISSKIKRSNERENILNEIFKMKNLGKMLNSTDSELNKDIKEFYLNQIINIKNNVKVYSIELISIIEKFVFEHCVAESQDEENDILNMLILTVSLTNNSKLSKIIEKNQLINKIIKFKLTGNDFTDSFASYLSSNSNKRINSKLFFQNFNRIFDYCAESKSYFNLEIINIIVEALLTHYKENMEFLSEEFVDCLNILIEKINHSSQVLLINDKLIQIIIKSIPRLFDNFHVNKIRKNILKILFKIMKLTKNTEIIFETIKKIHFHNNEGLLYCYILTQMNISLTSDTFSKFVLNNIKMNLDNYLEFSMIISLINFLNNHSNSNDCKKLVFEILNEIVKDRKIKFSNINLLFNYSKIKPIEKEFSVQETIKMLKTISENSNEIMFDKKYLKDSILNKHLHNETFKNFLDIIEGINSYSDYEFLINLSDLFIEKKIQCFSINLVDKFFAPIITNVSTLKKDPIFFKFISNLIETSLINNSDVKQEGIKIDKNEEYDFVSNLINNLLYLIPNDNTFSKETVAIIIGAISNYDISTSPKKNKGKNNFDLLYKLLKISRDFNVNILNYDFELDYKSHLMTFLTKLQTKELSLKEDELLISNFISLLNDHHQFKTEYLSQMINLLVWVQENDENQNFFSLKLHLLAVINNLLVEFTKKKTSSKYNNLNANYETDNILKIKNFIFSLISTLANKAEEVEDSETNLFNYLNLLNASFEIIVRFSINHTYKKEKNQKNVCIEILRETFKKIDDIRNSVLNNKDNLHISEKFISDINYLLIKSVNSLIFLVLSFTKGEKNIESTEGFISEFVKYSLLYFYNNIILKEIFDCIITTIRGAKDIFNLLVSRFISDVVYYNYFYSKPESIEIQDNLYQNYQMNYLTSLFNDLDTESKISIIYLMIKRSNTSNISVGFFDFNFLENVIFKKIIIKDLFLISKKEADIKTMNSNEKIIVTIIDICFDLYQHIKQVKEEITLEKKELFFYYKQLLSFEENMFDCLKETGVIYYLLSYIIKINIKKINSSSLNYILKKYFEALHLLTIEEIIKLKLSSSVNSSIELLKSLNNRLSNDSNKEDLIPQTIFSILTKLVNKDNFNLISDNFEIFSFYFTCSNNIVRVSCFVFISKLFSIFEDKLLNEFNNFFKEFISNIALECNSKNNEIVESFIDCLLVLTEKLGEYFSPFVSDLLKNILLVAKESNLVKLCTVFKKLSEKVIFDSNYIAVSNNISITFNSNDSLIKTKLIFSYLKNTLEKTDKIIIESMLLDITKFFIKSLQINKSKANIHEILEAFSVFVKKMNPRQLEKSLEKIISFCFKAEKESELGFNFEHSIIGYQMLNTILESAAQIFVIHLKKYSKYSNEILSSIFSIYAKSTNILEDENKKSRQFFDEKADYHNENSYLTLDALILENYRLNFKFDKDIILNDEIEEIIQPICNQLKLYTIEEAFYLKYFEESISNCVVEIMKSIKNDDIFKRFNDSILELVREDHFIIKLLALRTIKNLFGKMHEKYISLISDVVPFVMELLEDLNEKVSIEAAETIKTIEKLTGQNINDYIENNI